MKHQFIVRLGDNLVVDHRPATPGITDVLHNQVIANHGGEPGDYTIVEIETTDDRLNDQGLRPVLDASRESIIDFEWRESLTEARERRIAEIKALAAAKFDRDGPYPDWKVLRHIGQTNAGVTTDLTAAEYQALEVARQAVRDLSSQLEAEVESAVDVAAVMAVDISGLEGQA